MSILIKVKIASEKILEHELWKLSQFKFYISGMQDIH